VPADFGQLEQQCPRLAGQEAAAQAVPLQVRGPSPTAAMIAAGLASSLITVWIALVRASLVPIL
jgi:hypothetical protein